VTKKKRKEKRVDKRTTGSEEYSHMSGNAFPTTLGRALQRLLYPLPSLFSCFFFECGGGGGGGVWQLRYFLEGGARIIDFLKRKGINII